MNTIYPLLLNLILIFQITAQTITGAEREKSLNLLLSSQAKLKNITSSLTEKQLTFRPSSDRWSIKDNIDHLVSAEEIVWDIIHRSLDIANENNKSDFNDDEFIDILSTRKNKKFTAPEKLRPQDDHYKTFKDAMDAHQQVRTRSIEFIKTTNKDLRNHFYKSPLGMLDTYQWTLQISAHTLRHIEQIEEIITDDNFPK